MFENLSLFRLKVFCEVAETQSFHSAAENLNISQPSVSLHISMLEKETQLVLFERGRINKLTDAGRYLYEYANKILQITNEMANNIQELRNGSIGRIYFGANSSLIRYMITYLCKGFLKSNPKVEIVLSTGVPRKICDMALNREISFGIIAGIINHPELESKPISRDEIVIVVGPNHPLAGKEWITPQELSKQTFIYSGKAPAYLDGILSILNRHGISINQQCMEIDDMDSIKQALKNGIGISALLRQCVAEDLRTATLHEIKLMGGPLYIDLCLILRKDKFLSALSKKFLQYIDEAMKEKINWGSVKL